MTKPRFEQKYVVDLEQSRQFFEGALEHLIPDPSHPEGYQVNSVYHDTSDYQHYFEKLDGVEKRYKIRVRWYGELESEKSYEDTAVFIEIKHRLGQRVFKDRVKVPGSWLLELFQETPLSGLPVLDLDNCNYRQAEVVHRYLNRDPIVPTAVISYFRRPYLCRYDPTLRVTIDTGLTVSSPTIAPHEQPEGMGFLPPGLAILELKFHYSSPLWLADLTRACGLGLRRYSKYCSGLEALCPQLAHRQVRVQEAL